MVVINKHLIFYPLNVKNIMFAPTESGVYLLKNIINDKCYIGSAKNIKHRLQ
jgi:excinuclease UvrABC nuclease subunit